MVVGRRSFPIGKVTSQGRAVKLREGKILPPFFGQALELKDLQEVIDLKRAICKAKGLQHLEGIDGC